MVFQYAIILLCGQIMGAHRYMYRCALGITQHQSVCFLCQLVSGTLCAHILVNGMLQLTGMASRCGIYPSALILQPHAHFEIWNIGMQFLQRQCCVCREKECWDDMLKVPYAIAVHVMS